MGRKNAHYDRVQVSFLEQIQEPNFRHLLKLFCIFLETKNISHLPHPKGYLHFQKIQSNNLDFRSLEGNISVLSAQPLQWSFEFSLLSNHHLKHIVFSHILTLLPCWILVKRFVPISIAYQPSWRLRDKKHSQDQHKGGNQAFIQRSSINQSLPFSYSITICCIT